MPITVRDLLALPGLGLTVVAGASGLDRSIRWPHISELQDPTPWLSGGELLLTTGMDLRGSPVVQRSYIKRLVRANLAGLGFGVGFGFEEVPPSMRKAADVAGFPVLEVPYPVPFIAITEAISSRLSHDRLKDAQMSVEVHEQLAALVAEGGGPAGVLDRVVALARGWALLFDLRGRVLAQAVDQGLPMPDAQVIWRSLPEALRNGTGAASAAETGPRGTRVALAVTTGKRHDAVLVFGKSRRLDARDRIVVHHAVTLLGLLLASRRAVIETERRIAGDVLSEAFEGRLADAELERRLELLGFSSGARLAALVWDVPAEDGRGLADAAWALDAALTRRASASRTSVVNGRVIAAVESDDPQSLAEAVFDELTHQRSAWPAAPRRQPSTRMGVGEPGPPVSIKQSYLSALVALRAAPPDKQVVSQRDLGSFGFLLGGQPRPVLEGLVRSVVGPLIERDDERSSHLIPSVRAFIEAGGRWERGAEVLGIHRHTLRYRVRQAEELINRDLSSAEDRLEVWLALKAAELLEQ